MNIEGAVAIIGAAGRFPKARNVREFWDNLCAGRECLSVFSRDLMLDSGVRTETMDAPGYVPVRGTLGSIDQFDAPFFGFTPREAEFTDPQQRLFMECASEALESAGYDPDNFPGPIGLFGGSSLSNFFFLLNSMPEVIAQVGQFQLEIGTDKDFLCTRTSYKLNLQGPSLTVQTACSTSLVAVSLACQSLLTHQSDMALAGGVSIHIPEPAGYIYQEGSIMSPDGHCRAFDIDAQGTVGGNGVGLVVLKRFEDAVKSGDEIIAVIRGFALNNDGAQRVGFTAPSIEGQANVVVEALATAGVDAASISYVEAHGTATNLGDPIEIEALTRAFRASTAEKQFCAVGSVKTNIGHLDVAAGIAGLIKTALVVKHGLIPPSLHFHTPNPRIDFANSPFYVNSRLQSWPTEGPRRAGVSSFGFGGTNAHVILEEPPARATSSPSRPLQILPLAARTSSALEQAARNLVAHLESTDFETAETPGLADAAYTLALGRKAFSHRLAVVASDAREAARLLHSPAVVRSEWKGGARGVAMLFSGQGAQFAGMGRELYQTEAVFRQHIDRCCEIVNPLLGIDLRQAMQEGDSELLRQTWVTQPAVYILERALLRLYASWGIRPAAMLGHSLGELTAATEAGVWSEEEGLRLVALRGRLMWNTPLGAMLSVLLPEEEAARYQSHGISIAAINGKQQVVYAGALDEIEALEQTLTVDGKPFRRLAVERAFHSRQMDGSRDELLRELQKMQLHEPRLRFVSNVTGEWAGREVAEAEYWWQQLRQPVRFAAGVRQLAREQDWAWLEAGPGEALARLVRAEFSSAFVTASLSPTQTPTHALARLWVHGVKIDWPAYYANEQRHRVPLPTYPFERKSYWPWIPNVVAVVPASSVSIPLPPAAPASITHQERPLLEAPFIAPSTETEIGIAAVWRELLGFDRIGADDDFFELGGSSLLAIQMAQQLRTALDTEIPLELFLQNPTVSGLAGALALPRSNSAASAVLVPMRTSGSRPPFFAVHPIGGGCFIFRHLVERLGPQQPFYGLQALGLADIGNAGDPYSSLEEMASTYVAAIRTVQPRGPYFLGGLSWGGVAAFEMARQLTASGDEVSLVALLDTPAPSQLTKINELDDAAILVGLARDLAFQRGVDLPLTVEDVRAVSSDAQVSVVLNELQRAAILAADATAAWLSRHLSGYRSRLRMVDDYRPDTYEGGVTFFRAGEIDEVMRPHLDLIALDYNDPAFAWDRLSREPVEIHTIPGNHSEIVFEPSVRILADLLATLIERRTTFPEPEAAQPVSERLLVTKE